MKINATETIVVTRTTTMEINLYEVNIHYICNVTHETYSEREIADSLDSALKYVEYVSRRKTFYKANILETEIKNGILQPTKLVKIIEVITKAQATEFYRDLCGTIYGNANKNSQGIMSVALIADHMNISIERATEFCNAMIKYGITERCNGMIIV